MPFLMLQSSKRVCEAQTPVHTRCLISHAKPNSCNLIRHFGISRHVGHLLLERLIVSSALDFATVLEAGDGIVGESHTDPMCLRDTHELEIVEDQSC